MMNGFVVAANFAQSTVVAAGAAVAALVAPMVDDVVGRAATVWRKFWETRREAAATKGGAVLDGDQCRGLVVPDPRVAKEGLRVEVGRLRGRKFTPLASLTADDFTVHKPCIVKRQPRTIHVGGDMVFVTWESLCKNVTQITYATVRGFACCVKDGIYSLRTIIESDVSKPNQ